MDLLSDPKYHFDFINRMENDTNIENNYCGICHKENLKPRCFCALLKYDNDKWTGDDPNSLAHSSRDDEFLLKHHANYNNVDISVIKNSPKEYPPKITNCLLCEKCYKFFLSNTIKTRVTFAKVELPVYYKINLSIDNKSVEKYLYKFTNFEITIICQIDK